MKGVIVILFILGFALLFIESDAQRFIFQEGNKGNKGVVSSDATRFMPNDQNGNAARNTLPAASDEMNTTDDSSVSDDENESYGSYGNRGGPSTKTPHLIT